MPQYFCLQRFRVPCQILVLLMSLGFLLPEVTMFMRRRSAWPASNSIGPLLLTIDMSWVLLDSKFNFDYPLSATIRNCLFCVGIVSLVLRTFYYLSMTRKFGPIAITLLKVWKDVLRYTLMEVIAFSSNYY